MFSFRRVAVLIISLCSNRIVTKTEAGTRERGVAVTGLKSGCMWVGCGLWIRKAVEGIKQFSGSMASRAQGI